MVCGSEALWERWVRKGERVPNSTACGRPVTGTGGRPFSSAALCKRWAWEDEQDLKQR